MEPSPNSYLGQYLLQEVVGRSAGAVVYRAFQPNLNRRVAIKVLRGLDRDSVSRFEREVQAIARLQHQNILPIYDFGQQGSQRYFVMRYVEGGASLAHVIARGPLDPIAALRLLCRLLDALGYAHEQGIVHRDVKPSNILLPTPDWPLLADFGIARVSNAGQLTPPGMVIGTLAYMAPEAALERPLDGRADLYSAGVVLYEMLAGRVPFEAPTPLELLGKHISQPPPPPSAFHPGVPPAAEAVALRALAKDPADRYQSAAEMQAALATAIRQVERASAQVWLLGQLGHGAATQAPPRSGYTTRKLGPDAPPGAPRPRRPPHSGYTTHQLAPEPPPTVVATPRLARRPAPPPVRTARRGVTPALAIAAGLLLLLAIAALARFIGDGAVARAPTAPGAPSAVPQPTSPPAAGPPSAVPQPTSPPAAPPEAPPVVAGEQSIVLEDSSWSGGYASSGGTNRYGGRTATWIYGTASDYSTMSATFQVDGQPGGEALLRVEGMDSEGPARTPISIAVNGVEIYRGPNPLPDDDFPIESGTWASETWRFDGALLRPGPNVVTISNLAEGAFGGPPFFMLDYAELTYGA